MQLACDQVVPGLGCSYVAVGETAEEVHAKMLEHGAANHSVLMDGLAAAEAEEKAIEMSEHIYQLIADTN